MKKIICIFFVLILSVFNFSILSAQENVLVKEKSFTDFFHSVSIASDAKGFIYILDNESCEIIKLTEDLTEVKRIGKKGWDIGEFYSPSNIDCSTGMSLYVSDKRNGRIQVFDLNLGFMKSINTDLESLDPKYRCRLPSASILINTKDLYVADEDDPKIVIFESSVNPISYFASYQSGEHSLSLPVKISKDSRNCLYIFDAQRKSILKYDNFGSYISSFTLDNIKAMTITNNILYIISGNYLIYYDIDRGAYTTKIALPEEINKNEITDIYVTNTKKVYILEEYKLSSLLIK